MKLFEILDSFLKGNKICRGRWGKGVFIELNKSGETVRLCYLDNYDVKLINSDTNFSIDDLQANDWKLFDA